MILSLTSYILHSSGSYFIIVAFNLLFYQPVFLQESQASVKIFNICNQFVNFFRNLLKNIWNLSSRINDWCVLFIWKSNCNIIWDKNFKVIVTTWRHKGRDVDHLQLEQSVCANMEPLILPFDSLNFWHLGFEASVSFLAKNIHKFYILNDSPNDSNVL